MLLCTLQALGIYFSRRHKKPVEKTALWRHMTLLCHAHIKIIVNILNTFVYRNREDSLSTSENKYF
jgi:hypothetical protein